MCPSYNDKGLKNLGLAFLSAVKILPAANLLPATTKTTFKSDILRLETSLQTDYYPFKSIIPLLETVLDDKPNDHDIWHQAWEAVVNESGRSQKFGSYTDYASNVDGRQYLLRELPNVEQTYDRETWTRMTRDLFHNLDRPLFDIRAVFVTFLNDYKKDLPKTCAKWAFPVCLVLRQLAIEMRLTVDLLKFGDWDDGILKDALEALRYSIFDFLGPIVMVLHNYCNANKDEKYTGGVKIGVSDFLGTFGEVGNFCINCLVNAELALMSLMLHLSLGQANRDGQRFSQTTELADLQALRYYKDLVATPVANKVPTATFTELVIQNQSLMCRRSIVTTLGNTDIVSASDRICMSTVHYFQAQADPLRAVLLSKQIEKRSECPIAQRAGIPRCLTIIADRKTGLVTTGATQPAYDPDFPWLDKVGKQIHRLRIGETFREAVHLCSDNVAQLVQDGCVKTNRKKLEDLDEGEIDKIYSEYMAAAKQAGNLSTQPHKISLDPMSLDSMPQVRGLGMWYTRLTTNRRNEGFETMPGPDDTIFCWAFDTDSFKLKPPCLRCQRMFSRWVLSKNPDDINGRRDALKGLYARDALRYNKKHDTCSYCAETVAAAKIHLLRRGRLLLG